MPIGNLACMCACINRTMAIDIKPGSLYVLADLSELHINTVYKDVHTMGGIFIFDPDPIAASYDLFMGKTCWFEFARDDLIIFKLKYGARIRAQLTAAQMEEAMEIVNSTSPGERQEMILTALATSADHNPATWSTNLRTWARGVTQMRSQVTGRHLPKFP